MREFIQNFLKAKGLWISVANLLSKLSSLALSLWVARYLSPEAFGQINTLLNYTALFSAFLGLGLLHPGLKYASAAKDIHQQKQIFAYSFYYGFLGQLLINLVLFLIATHLFPAHLWWIVACFALRFCLIFVAEQAKNIARSQFDNQKFALMDISQALLAIVLAFGLSFYDVYWAYVLALSLSPMAIFLFYKPEFKFKKPKLEGLKLNEFWQFGLKTALTVQVSEWLLLLDIFYIGQCLGDAAVAHYRLASILPFNMMILGQMIMQTFFPRLCAEHRNPKFHKQFIAKYSLFMLLVSALILGISLLFEAYILALLHLSAEYFHIYLWGLMACFAAFLLRIPYGFLLSSLGKNIWNLISAILALGLVLLAYPYFIPVFGLQAAAIINFLAIVFTGVFTGVAYFYELKKISEL